MRFKFKDPIFEMFRNVTGNVDGSEEDDGHQDRAEGSVPRMHATADSTGECATKPIGNRVYVLAGGGNLT